MLDEYPLDPLVEKEVNRRLLMGVRKYGKSWSVVDLKTDMLEEMYDILNYARMMLVRAHAARGLEMDFTMMERVLTTLVGDITERVIEVQRFIPDFEGPTSNEWLEDEMKRENLV